MTTAIRFTGVSKRYRRGHAPSFKEDTVQAVKRLVGRAEPKGLVEALRDVSFDLECGASLAVMGANGSGKTTALRLISRVTYPTEGLVQVRGRVGALMEVGTGLHPELTGRENISLYGRILGLSGRDIALRLDNIIEFAAIGQAIDQPVKQYSTGMQLRLGFSLASHLEPDVLLVDEAISVGDARFQRRCMQRMLDLHRTGVTLVFVSHIASAVAALCSDGILLQEGSVTAQGPVGSIIEQYLTESVEPPTLSADVAPPIQVRSWDYELAPAAPRFMGNLDVRLQLRLTRPITNPRFGLAIGRVSTGPLIACFTDDALPSGALTGDIEVVCTMEDVPLEAGEYDLWLVVTQPADETVLLPPTLLGFMSLGRGGPMTRRSIDFAGVPRQPSVRVADQWQINRVEDDLQPLNNFARGSLGEGSG